MAKAKIRVKTGVFGLRKDGIDKLTGIFSDSSPEETGVKIVEFLMTTTIDELHKLYDKMILLDMDIAPYDPELWDSEIVSVCNDNELIYYSLYCQYGYIINLDDSTLEFWKGFQKKKDYLNRYGQEDVRGYYPCKMLASYPIENISYDSVMDMGDLSDQDDDSNGFI